MSTQTPNDPRAFSLPEGNEQITALLTQLMQGLFAEDEAPHSEVELSEAKARIKELSKALRRAKKTIRAQREQNAVIASTLGACECWGAHQRCRTCAGAGTPGFFAPEPNLFEELIGPLLVDESVHPDDSRSTREPVRNANERTLQ